jgi:uncharacterized phage-like protein YoqJ
MMMIRIAFTGHRPNSLGASVNGINIYDRRHPLRQAIRQAIVDMVNIITDDLSYPAGIITGGALGVDTDAAAAARRLQVPFMIAAPCRNQDARWPTPSRVAYRAMTSDADPALASMLAVNGEAITGGVVYVYNGTYPGAWCLHRRNEWMVDHSDVLIAVYNGSQSGGTYSCIQYAEKQNKRIVYIDPNDL